MDRERSFLRFARALLLAFALLAVPTAAATAAPITEFTTGVSDPTSLTAGPDGNVWFIEQGTTKAIGRITPSGQVTEFTAGLKTGSAPSALALGSDGNLWFTDPGTTKAIGRITPSGQITEFTTGLKAGGGPTELTAGPNGTLWFLDPMGKAVGRVTVSTGAIKEFDYTQDPTPTLDRIAPGPDGNVYFTDKGNVPGIGKVTPDGTVSEVVTPGAMSMPSELGGGPDGSVWFSDQQSPNAIGRLSAGGTVNEFSAGLQTNAAADAVVGGPDGKVWFDDQYNTHPAVGSITPTGQITEFPTPSDPSSIVFGVDGNLWASEYGTPVIQRITPTGAMTTFSAGLKTTADLLESELIVGPDGNLWFTDRGPPKAIGRINVQAPPSAVTGAATTVSSSGATLQGTVDPRGAATTTSFQYGRTAALGFTVAAESLTPSGDPSPVSATITGLPAGTTIFYRVMATNAYGAVPGSIRSFVTPAAAVPITSPGPAPHPVTTTRRIGDQLISLVTPATAVCTARRARLTFILSVARIAHVRRTRVRFASAAVFIDRGTRHRRVRHVRGRRRTVITLTPNATLRHLPATRSLSLSGLRAGVHRLSVTVVFTRLTRHRTLTHTTLRMTFRIC